MNNNNSTQRIIELLEDINDYNYQMLEQLETLNRMMTYSLLLAMVIILTM